MESFHRLIDKSSSIGVIFVDEENTEEVRIVKELEQGCNSIDTLNFEGQTGPHSGPNSALGHCKLRHVSKLQT